MTTQVQAANEANYVEVWTSFSESLNSKELEIWPQNWFFHGD